MSFPFDFSQDKETDVLGVKVTVCWLKGDGLAVQETGYDAGTQLPFHDTSCLWLRQLVLDLHVAVPHSLADKPSFLLLRVGRAAQGLFLRQRHTPSMRP